MRHVATILLPSLLLVCGEALCAPDGFNNVQCGADIPSALRGRIMSNETIVTIENRHKSLGLENLGADELEKGWFLSSWRICGDEYMLIEDNRFSVRDVLEIPPHSRGTPESSGPCTMNGAAIPGVVVAILDRKGGGADLPASVAWRVDERQGKFIPLSTTGLLCSRSGIITVDGGM